MLPSQRNRIWLAGIATILCIAALSNDARAGMRAGTRPGYFEGSAGPAFQMTAPTLVSGQLAIEVGGHFLGRSSGPALGFSAETLFRPGRFALETGPKFRWDIQVIRGRGFYLTPTIRTGYALFKGRGAPAHYFNIQAGFEFRFIFNNRGIFFFRPFSVDIDFWHRVQAVAYDLMIGGGVTFP